MANQPCPDCGSSDALQDYGNRTKCFSCGKFVWKNRREPMEMTDPNLIPQDHLQLHPLPSRGLFVETCQKFNYGYDSGAQHQVANYYDSIGRLVAQKLRSRDKQFFFKGDPKASLPLFGQHLWASGGPRLIITEGEIDAMSIAQVYNFSPFYATVSVRDGAAGAKRNLQASLEYLQQFDEIVLAFDNDEPGRKAIEECVGLFRPGTVKILNYPVGAKDANEVLLKNGPVGITDALANAKDWRPDGIHNGAELWEAINKPIEEGWSYPWDSLTKLTYGIRLAELTIIGAGTGVGKTDWFRELETHLILNHKVPCGILHLEERKADTLLGLMSKAKGKLFHIPEGTTTEEEKREAFDLVTKGNCCYIFDSFGETSFDIVYNRIRYMVAALGVKVVFLDHITALTDGLGAKDNINQHMKNIMNKLASVTRELNFSMFAISHLRKPEGKPHEEGGRVHLDDLIGSSAIKQWASFVWGLERNQQAEDLEERNKTIVRGLKDRYTGRALGHTVELVYCQDSGRSKETGAIWES